MIDNDVYEEISSRDVELLLNDPGTQIVDVRDSEGFEKAHIPGSQSIPLDEISDRIDEIDKSKQIITVCKCGQTSQKAATLLSVKGYNVKSMNGGIEHYKGEIRKGIF